MASVLWDEFFMQFLHFLRIFALWFLDYAGFCFFVLVCAEGHHQAECVSHGMRHGANQPE